MYHFGKFLFPKRKYQKYQFGTIILPTEVIKLRLKEIRLSMNLSQKDVADYLGTNSNVYSRYETGERQPSIDVLMKLSEFFGKSIDYIVENHAEVDFSISSYEMELITAAREADDRAREDALNTLKAHKVEKRKVKDA